MRKLFSLTILLIGLLSSNCIISQNAFSRDARIGVIICGSELSLDERQWRGCAEIYDLLLTKGYTDENIYFYHPISPNLRDSTLAIPSINCQQFIGGRRVLNNMFAEIMNECTSNDELFVYIAGPVRGGTLSENEHYYVNRYAYLQIYGQWEEVSASSIANSIVSINALHKNILVQTDYSGAFIAEFKRCNAANIVVTTACGGRETAGMRLDGRLDEFLYWWLGAMNGSNIDGMLCPADFNNDGAISMVEAYTYARAHDERGDHSEIYSNPECLKYQLDLEGSLSNSDCENGNLIEGVDLYMKDSEMDMGEVPNTITEKSYISDDIWVEDRFGNRVYSLGQEDTYDLHVRIHNRGTQPSSGTERLHVHWTKATIGGAWPYGWYEDYVYTCENSVVIRGNEITDSEGLLLPVIQGGETYEAIIEWTTPYVNMYADCSIFADNPNELGHVCLLARLYEEREQPGITMEEEPLWSLVLNSNNVISRNISIVPYRTDGIPVGLVAPYTGVFDFSGVVNSIFADSIYSLYLSVSDELYDMIQYSQNTYGLSEVDYHKFLITDRNFGINDIYLESMHVYPVMLSMEEHQNSTTGVAQVDISIRDVNETNEVGGNRFEWSNKCSIDSREYMPSIKPAERKENNEIFIPDETAVYYDIFGNLIKTKNIQSLSPGVYIIKQANSINKIFKN